MYFPKFNHTRSCIYSIGWKKEAGKCNKDAVTKRYLLGMGFSFCKVSFVTEIDHVFYCTYFRQKWKPC